MVDEDDFFWQIAMVHENGTDTTWIVPNDEELLPDGNGPEPFHKVLEADICAPLAAANSDIHSVHFQELLLESGVMSKIGGEVWEASLLLCAYIMLHRDRLLTALQDSDCCGDCEVMELGSGVGLPGLLIASLLRHHRSPKSGTHVTLTDFDDGLLENLCTNIMLNDFKVAEERGSSSSTSSRITLSVDYLNWFDFKTTTSVPIESTRKRNSVDIMVGSALIYSPSHAAVADVIDYFLRPNGGLDTLTRRREAVVIQIGDRAGMDYFQRRLTAVGLSWSIGEVSEECYHLAKNGMVIQKCDPQPRAGGRTQRLSIDMLCLNSDCAGRSDYSKNDILRTPRECFRLIRVWKAIS